MRLAHANRGANVADARRAKALLAGKQRFHGAPQRFVGGGQACFVARQPNPCAVERQLLEPRHSLQGRGEGGCRQPRLELQPQPFESDAG